MTSQDIILYKPKINVNFSEPMQTGNDVCTHRWIYLYLPTEDTTGKPWPPRFTIVMGVVLILILTGAMAWYGKASLQDNKWIGPKLDEGIITFFVTEHDRVLAWQFWRPFSSLFIVKGILAYMIYLPILLVVGSQLESELAWMFPIMFLMSGTYGNLVAVISDNQYMIGPYFSLTGINGALLCEIIFNDRTNQAISWFIFILGVVQSCVHVYLSSSLWLPITGSHLIGFLLATIYRTELRNNKVVTVNILGKTRAVEKNKVQVIAKLCLYTLWLLALVTIIVVEIIKKPVDSSAKPLGWAL